MCPMFDVGCPSCGWEDEVFTHHDLPGCPKCGAATNKVWRSGSFPGVLADSIPGGMVIENLSSTPITVYSHSEHRAVMAAHGAKLKVRHVGVQGSDKSPHTSRWV